MGLLGDLLDAGVDALVDLPGDAVKVAAKTVTRLPEVGIKVIAGAAEGIEAGAEAVEKAADEAFK